MRSEHLGCRFVVVAMVMDLNSLVVGQRTSLVLAMVCHCSQGNWHLTQSQDRRACKIWLQGDVPSHGSLVGVDLLVTSLTPLQLEVDSESFVCPVPVCTQSALSQVVELCSGLGGFPLQPSRLDFR